MNNSGGWGEDVTDQEIIDGIKLLAETEGVFTETAGGVTIAVTKKLVEKGVLPKDESIVVAITGNGLKTQEAITNDVSRPHIIDANLEEFEELYDRLNSENQGGSEHAISAHSNTA
jgi:threonine synthase